MQHPKTLTSVYCLAYLLQKQKRYVEASELYQRACDGYKDKLGSQHPTAIACLNHFAAMQQEAEQDGVGQREALNNRETPTHDTSLKSSSKATTGQASGSQKIKQRTFYTCLREKVRR